MLSAVLLAFSLAATVQDTEVLLERIIEDLAMNAERPISVESARLIDGLQSPADVPDLWRLLEVVSPTHHRVLQQSVIEAICRLGDESDFQELVLRAHGDGRLLEGAEECAVTRALRHLPAAFNPGDDKAFDSSRLPDHFLTAGHNLRRAYLRYQSLIEAENEHNEGNLSFGEHFSEARLGILGGDSVEDWLAPYKPSGRLICGTGAAAAALSRRTVEMIDLLRKKDYLLALQTWMWLPPSYDGERFDSGEWLDGFVRIAAAAGEPADEILLGAVLHGRTNMLFFLASLESPRRGLFLQEFAAHIAEGDWERRLQFLWLCSQFIGKGPLAENRTVIWVRPSRFEHSMSLLADHLQTEILDRVSRWTMEANPFKGQAQDQFARTAADLYYELLRPETRKALQHLSKWPDEVGEMARMALEEMEAETAASQSGHGH